MDNRRSTAIKRTREDKIRYHVGYMKEREFRATTQMQACKGMTYFDLPIFRSRCKHLRISAKINTEDRIIVHHKSFLERFYIFTSKYTTSKEQLH